MLAIASGFLEPNDGFRPVGRGFRPDNHPLILGKCRVEYDLVVVTGRLQFRLCASNSFLCAMQSLLTGAMLNIGS